MPLVPLLAGQDGTALAFNTAIDTSGNMVYQGTDSTPVNNSVVLVASTYLTLPVIANAFYMYESMILYDSSATANFQHLIVLPTFATNGQMSRLNITTAGTLTLNVDTSLSTASQGGGVGTSRAVFRSGTIATAVTVPGTVSIQFSQNTANASNTVLKLGSWIRLTQVG